MALHEDFPSSPYDIVDPGIRWFPEDGSHNDQSADKLIPPLVGILRREVKKFRDGGYVGVSSTSQSLLNWWFNHQHYKQSVDGRMSEFQYYFAQREAIETIVYLFEVVGVKDKYDMMRFDETGIVNARMFNESWRRFVLKMATGTGKTKVMSLALVWSYFHKLYEPESELARNFLIITPNIIVLDRLYRDFQGLNIFYEDPALPKNGFNGRDWQHDFQLTMHKQDDVRVIQAEGNIFLTNVHRIYTADDIPSAPEDDNTMNYFLGTKPSGATSDSKVDLGIVIRDIEELVVINDEAHHIHDSKLAWFKSIQDIHNRLLQKGSSLSLQVDLTATPKHSNGEIFVQTVADYPLVEAISQNVVKHPVLPDEASRAKLTKYQSVKFTEKYADYINLGVIEWRKAFAEHKKLGKKAILFAMTDDTRNCDELASYLESHYLDLKDSVLVIHTNKNGDISEATSGKAKKELEKLRQLVNEIDFANNPYKAIVSVLMLKEGWDVRNVTNILGLRAYTALTKILPEQTLGRGLRKMYAGNIEEYVSVVGTDAFMDFVESIQSEGVVLERKPMGHGYKPYTPLVIIIDHENEKKDIDKLDIDIPILTPHIYRVYKNLNKLDLSRIDFQVAVYNEFSKEEQRKIVFRDIASGEVAHTTTLDPTGTADYRNVVGYFARTIMNNLRMVSGYAMMYGKIKCFVQTKLFGQTIELGNPNTLRNLSEPAVIEIVINTFAKAINAYTIKENGSAEIQRTIKLRNTQPFVVKDQSYVVPKKSVFNRIVGDSHFELKFAQFLEDCQDVVSYSKNYLVIGFSLNYVNTSGAIAKYYPDFLVKLTNNEIVIVETKGLEDSNVPSKMACLRQWCEDINQLNICDVKYDFAYVDYDGFMQHKYSTFQHIMARFKEYKQ